MRLDAILCSIRHLDTTPQHTHRVCQDDHLYCCFPWGVQAHQRGQDLLLLLLHQGFESWQLEDKVAVNKQRSRQCPYSEREKDEARINKRKSLFFQHLTTVELSAIDFRGLHMSTESHHQRSVRMAPSCSCPIPLLTITKPSPIKGNIGLTSSLGQEKAIRPKAVPWSTAWPMP